MAELFKDAFQSMDFSTEKLGEVLEVAKQSDAKKLNERELRQIEEMLRKLSESFESVSAQEILQTKVARGEFAGQKEKLDDILDYLKEQEITYNDILFKRPGTGIPANKYKEIIGRHVNRDIEENKTLFWEDLVK